MLADLERSCLTEEHALLMRCRPSDLEELRAMGLPAKTAYELPYFGLDGKPSGYRRWRYLEDTREGLAAKTDAKPMRYAQPPGTAAEVYLPPLVDWRRLAEDATVPLVITEGEKKAAACTSAGRPCLGLGGVYSFKSTKRGQPLVPAFRGFVWTGRRVVVAYDSDAHQNRMVVAARNELCRALLDLGAEPAVCDLDPADDGSKRGLDDLLFQEGQEALAEALDYAVPWSAAAALHELSEEVAYVVDPGMVVVVGTGQKMRPSDFVGHAYSNRHFWEQVTDAKGGQKLVRKPAARAWLDWEHRFALRSVCYQPGEPQVTDDRRYNTWPGWGCEPVKGEVGPWKRLLDRLFHGHPEERRWFERWCALPLQRPGAKMYTCCLLWGVETGTGKSLVGYTLGRIYGRNFAEITDAELSNPSNDWAVDKQFVMGDDVTGEDQRQYADRLKTMMTRATVRINVKYVPTYSVPDVLNYYFTSNHPDAMFLEDRDRRAFVHEVTSVRMAKAEVDEYVAWMKGPGPAALFDHLRRLDLGGQEPEGRAPETAARAAMIDDGQSALGRWVRELRDSPDTALRLPGGGPMDGDLWSSQDLLRAYDPEGKTRTTASAVSRELKRAGFRQAYGGRPVLLRDGRQARLFAVRQSAKWLGLDPRDRAVGPRLAEHYAETRGRTAKTKKF